MTFQSECAHYYRILIQKEGGTQEERWKHELCQLNMKCHSLVNIFNQENKQDKKESLRLFSHDS